MITFDDTARSRRFGAQLSEFNFCFPKIQFVRGDNLTKCQTLSCPFLKKDMTKFEVLKKLILQRTRCRINFF